MNALVLYQSRTGNTRAAAEAIGRAVRAAGHQAVVKSVIEVGPSDIAEADVLFIGTWIQGFILFGVKPAGAEQWVPALPALDGKPVGVFCTYAFNPRNSLTVLGDRLAARGARIVGRRAFHRSRLEEGVDQFVNEALESA